MAGETEMSLYGRPAAAAFALLLRESWSAGRCVILATLYLPAMAHSLPLQDVADADRWTPRGQVRAIATTPDVIYVGGDFSGFSDGDGSGVVFDPTSRQITPPLAPIYGTVTTALADGNGGWFVGGDFITVGHTRHRGLVHLRHDSSVDESWSPQIESNVALYVNSIVRFGDVLFVGGAFDRANGVAHANICAVNALTGTVYPWNPACDAPVNDLAILGNTLYVGGSFTHIGGSARARLAALDANTGLATPWNPSPNGEVLALGLAPDALYVSGTFSRIDTASRTFLAAIALPSGNVLPWTSDTILPPQHMQVAGNLLVTSGLDVGALGSGVAIVSRANGNTLWSRTSSVTVGQFAVEENLLYYSTDSNISACNLQDGSNQTTLLQHTFSTTLAISDGALFMNDYSADLSTSYSYLAAVDPRSGKPLYPLDNPRGAVKALALAGPDLIVGGGFLGNSTARHPGVEAINRATHQLREWDPKLDSSSSYLEVRAIDVQAQSVIVGGTFDEVSGLVRNNVAEVNLETAAVSDWDPQFETTSDIYAIRRFGNTVYIGGNFGSVGGYQRRNLVAVDAITGQPTPWSPAPDARVQLLFVNGSTLYVGGYFKNIAGHARGGAAAFDLATGSLLPWNPNADGGITQILAHDDAMYLLGTFRRLGGVARLGGAAINLASGALLPWNPDFGDFTSGAFLGGTLYGGGPGPYRTFAAYSPQFGALAFTNIHASPATAQTGERVSISFDANAPTEGPPDVRVNGNAAIITASTGYAAEYTVRASDLQGAALIEVDGIDRDGNVGHTESTDALRILDEPRLALAALPVAVGLGLIAVHTLRRRKAAGRAASR